MRDLLRYILLFLLILFIQVFIVRHVEIGMGTQLFLLPLYIIILPFRINVFMLMILAFILGILYDTITNSYGLNASALIFVAFLRPIIFDVFHPKEGYDVLKVPTVSDMGWRWFFFTYTTIILLHNTWFFVFEIFRITEWLLIIRNIFTSLIFSLAIALMLNLFLFVRKNS